MSELVTVSVTIPSTRLQDLYTYAATLHTQEQAPPVNTPEELGTKDEPKQRAAAGFGAATVKKSYLGGVSDYWRPFLQELAKRPGEWVSWEDLYTAINLEPNQAAGMLGAAERRCKLLPPYEKAYEDYTYWFRMPTSVAEIVTELAAK